MYFSLQKFDFTYFFCPHEHAHGQLSLLRVNHDVEDGQIDDLDEIGSEKDEKDEADMSDADETIEKKG